jgi:cytochrome c oxidase subunit 4
MTTDNKSEAHLYAHAEADMTKSRIWKIFFYLLGLTALEFIIALGFVETGLIEKGTSVIVIYILLTLLKAYYIVAYFMHLKFEKIGFSIMLGVPLILLIYLIILVFIEGNYIGMFLYK